jgi:pimeloyl-ACP methyl ester carboxylesterase
LIKRGFVDLDEGQIHYRQEGKRGETVLLLHQTPRSSDEFLEVIPCLAKKFRVLAPDMVGMGDSFKPRIRPTIQDYSRWMFEFMDKLGVSEANLVGHHTGAVIALEMAASQQNRVKHLVLSSSPYVNKEKRMAMKSRGRIDEFKISEDGSHLTDLWNRRKSFYPKNRPELLNRLLIDVLKAGELAEVGHQAVAKYKMEERIGLVKCPTLVICGSDDQFAFPDYEILASKLKYSTSKVIPRGRVPMPDQMPKEFCEAIEEFLTMKNFVTRRQHF